MDSIAVGNGRLRVRTRNGEAEFCDLVVRAVGVNTNTFLRRIHEDLSLAYRILQTMSRRIQELENEMVRLIEGD